MQLVLSNNRVIAHGENFLVIGGVVINTETGARFENATIAECEGCPSDIDRVGYEYHAGVFVPCAPYGMGNNNGFFMEVCESCAAPRNSGIPIKGGIKLENLDLTSVTPQGLGGAEFFILWENAYTGTFSDQTLTMSRGDYTFAIVECREDYNDNPTKHYAAICTNGFKTVINHPTRDAKRTFFFEGESVTISSTGSTPHYYSIPHRIYGVKL